MLTMAANMISPVAGMPARTAAIPGSADPKRRRIQGFDAGLVAVDGHPDPVRTVTSGNGSFDRQYRYPTKP
jgi:hypothetical protein